MLLITSASTKKTPSELQRNHLEEVEAVVHHCDSPPYQYGGYGRHHTIIIFMTVVALSHKDLSE